MYRTALRSSPGALRAIRTSSSLTSAPRRFLTTAPASNKSTWKGAATRWGLAIAAVYWYNTSPIFADEPASQTIPPPSQFSDADLPTVEAVIEQKRRETRTSSPPPATASAPATAESTSPQTTTTTSPGAPGPQEDGLPGAAPGSPEALEEEAGQQGAFNPETGEINWDCPCLGGMAHGPCGEEFKAAFSCFVFSEAEPKGMDCIDKFQHMQDCFRKYPEIYGAELQEDEDEEAPVPVGGAEGGEGEGVGEAVARAGEQVMDAAEGVKEQVKETATEVKEKVVEQESKTVAEVKRVEAGKKAEAKKVEHPGVPAAEFDATSANEVSYAEIAAKGPKQTPEEAAAPQPPQVEVSESTSTSSLIDVDSQSVHTVPSDFMEQDVKTDTQAERLRLEREAREAADEARAEADLAKKKAARKAHKADSWLTRQFESMSDGAASTLVLANFLAVVGLSSYLGFKAWGLYERGRFGWKHAGVGLGVLGVVGAFEGVFTNYLQKGKGKKQ